MTAPPHTRYLEWNDRLAAHFFNPEVAGRAVYLYVNNDLIAEIGKSFGAHPDDFIAAVQDGPPWVSHGGLCQRALQATENWRSRNLLFPPYVAYLCLFVLAAGADGEFAPHAYYPRLRRLLGYSEGSMLPSFDRMVELWDDLERWTNKDKAGALGLFEARIAGNWFHVGLPIAQTILTEHERRSLPRIFFQAGLDPTSTPPAAELARALRTHGTDDLRPRTLNLLSTHADEESYTVLLETVAEELMEWDGHVDEATPMPATTTVRSFAVARLCMTVDSIAGTALCTLRLKINRAFPEDQLALSTGAVPSPLYCEEYLEGWSSPVCLETGPVDATRFDWLQGAVLRDDRLGWHFKLPGRPVRVFINGSSEQLPGLIEIQALPRSEPFYLVYHSQASTNLRAWLEQDCRDVRHYANMRGLPTGWAMVSVQETFRDSIRRYFPFLSFTTGVRMRFIGGLWSSAGNNFFSFAPPDLLLEGGDGGEQVTCNGETLRPTPTNPGQYQLPGDLPVDTKISIEIRRGEHVIRRSAYLTSDFSWKFSNPLRQFNRWGLPAAEGDTGTAYFAGPFLSRELPDTRHFRRPPLFAVDLDHVVPHRIFILGAKPGQIACWPAESISQDWIPVWAIPFGRRGQAIYCGAEPGESAPSREAVAQKDKVELWKEVLWHNRKRITVPSQRVLRKLWQEYIEVARNV